MPTTRKPTTRHIDCLNYIRRQGSSSRSEIAGQLGLNKRTVATIIDDLLQDGLITITGHKKSSAGRRQELLCLDAAHSNYIGIDLGGTHITGVLTDLQGTLFDHIFFEIRPGLPMELILDQLTTIAGRLLESPKASATVQSIGVSLPGFVNPQSGVSYMAENIPGWKEVNIRELFHRQFNLPVYIEDCSRSHGIAEQLIGKGQLMELGIPKDFAIITGVSSKSYWHLSKTYATNAGMPNKWLEKQGLINIKQLWCKVQGYC